MKTWLKRNWRVLAWVTGTAIALLLYISSCKSMWERNPIFDPDAQKSYDQTFYMAYAARIAEGPGELLPRSRMPLYPWIMHFFFDPAKSTDEMANVYIRLNVSISVCCLGAIFFMLRRPLGTWLSVLVTLAVGMRVFVFKAALIQPEILFYTLYLALFLAMLRYLQRPSWRLALGGGLLAGAAHLTKGSALPMIAIFLALAAVKEILDARRAPSEPGGKLTQRLLRPLVFAGAFLLVAGTFMFNSYREYGSPFYDPNTRYYFWGENPGEMGALQRLGLASSKPHLGVEDLSDPLVLEFLPKWVPDPSLRDEMINAVKQDGRLVLEGKYDILPSFKKWTAAHTTGDAWRRVWIGLVGDSDSPEAIAERRYDARNRELIRPRGIGTSSSLIGHNRLHSNGYYAYLKFLATGALVALGLALFFARGQVWRAAMENCLPILFASSSILTTTLGYAWWGEISNRNRYFLSLYLPLMLCSGLLLRFGCSHIPAHARITCRRLSFKMTACTLFLTGFSIFALFDLNDPLNRRNLSDSGNVAEQLVQ